MTYQPTIHAIPSYVCLLPCFLQQITDTGSSRGRAYAGGHRRLQEAGPRESYSVAQTSLYAFLPPYRKIPSTSRVICTKHVFNLRSCITAAFKAERPLDCNATTQLLPALVLSYPRMLFSVHLSYVSDI